MAHFKKPYKKKKEGKIIYGDGIVNTIVTLAIAEIPNVELYSGKARGKDYSKSIDVKYNQNDVFVDVAVKINYLQSVSEMAFKIQEVVRHNVEAMTEYHISGVNVNVKGVLFDEKPTAKVDKKSTKKEKKQVETVEPETVIKKTLKSKKTDAETEAVKSKTAQKKTTTKGKGKAN